jgi:hypothetical protein
MIKRPNGIIINKTINDRRYNIIYHRVGNIWDSILQLNYNKVEMSLFPLDNWLDYIPNKEFVHPILIEISDKGGFNIHPYDTFNEIMWDGKPTTLETLNNDKLVYPFFDRVLDGYSKLTDEELLVELNIGRPNNPWTMEELLKL